MALFTDPNVITIDDLLRFENSINQVSMAQSIDVPTKIQIASDNIGDKLLLGLLRAGLYNPNNLFATSLGLQSVIVTPSLYRWMCFDSLARVFAEAYNAQLNTRFQGKWTEYQKLAEDTAHLVMAGGLSLVSKPLPRPPVPVVTVGQGSIAAPAVFVQTAWIDAQGRESAPSPVGGSVLSGFSSVQVNPVKDPASVPTYAVAWNVYASLTQQGLGLQNMQPLALGIAWQMPSSGLIAGAAPSGGQTPDLLAPLASRLQRG